MTEIDLDDIEDMTDEEIAAAVRSANDPERPSALRKELKRAQRERDEAREAVKAATDLARENAFLKAGINVDDPKLRYFAEGYKGELTAEAIKAEAAEAGFIQAVVDPNLTEAQRAARVSVGAETPNQAPETRLAEGVAAINTASSQDEVLAAYAAAGGRVKNPLDE
jgi:hypothetical protein